MEDDTLRLHLGDAALDDRLLELEIRDAVAEQTARRRVLLEDVHLMAGASELLGRGEPRRPRADDGDALAGFGLGRLRLNRAVLDRLVGNGALDGFDGHGHVVDVERAGGFARRRADAPGDLRKIVRRVEIARGFSPLAVEDEVVPIGDLVVDRAAVVTIGDAAIHAAAGLRLDVLLWQRFDELAPMFHALGDRLIAPVGALEVHEAGDLAHCMLLSVNGGLHLGQCHDIHFMFCISLRGPMQIVRWANSLAVRLPAAFVDRLRLSVGADVALRAKADDTEFGGEQSPGFGEEQNDPIMPDTAMADDGRIDKVYTVTVGKWGNSLAIRLPRDLVAGLRLAEGDEVMIEDVGADMLVITRELSIDELFDRVRSLRRLLPADYKFDREEANARVPHEQD